MGGHRSATSTPSCTAPPATAGTAWAAGTTPTAPTARGAGTASTASGARRAACPAAATPWVSVRVVQLMVSQEVERLFCRFLITAHIGDVYSVVLWLKLSLDLTGLGVAGADSSPLQHLLLQMCSKIVVFIFFSTTVYVLPWTHPALKHSFKFLINKITRADILGNSLHRRMVVNISSISFSYWVSKHYKYKPVKP